MLSYLLPAVSDLKPRAKDGPIQQRCMDVICIGCGEPWDLITVLHDEPDSFDRHGCVIRSCPCCEARKREGLPMELIEDLRIFAEMAELLDGDIDGFAVWCEDHWPLRINK